MLMTSLVAGCSTVSRTLDFSADPELQRKGAFPNINNSGPAQPGTVMTPEELAATKAALEARGAQATAIGAAAQAEGSTSAQELETLARTHGQKTLQEIQQGCANGTADATKCPQ